MGNPTHGLTAATFTPSDLERYWSKVEKTDGCWFWRPALNPAGYGTFSFRGTSTSAHRAGYLIANGEIPEGKVLDHICRNRHCVNPDHLEPVTPRTNSRRSPLVYKSHCPEGHEYSPENTVSYTTKAGSTQRYCIQCRNRRSRENQRRYRAERRSHAVG